MEFNAKKCHELKMEKSGMRPTWTYKLGHNIKSLEKEEIDSGVAIQDNFSPENHID